MSDSFLDPRDQANLDALKQRLSSLDAEIRTASETIAAEASALREQQGRRQSTARAEGASGRRSTASAAPYLQQELEAINEQVVSYERLNQLISERIGLERQAATAARATAVATTAAPAAAARAAGAAPATVEESLAAQATAQEVWYAQMRKQQEAAALPNRSHAPEVGSQAEYSAGLQGAASEQARARALGQAQALDAVATAEARAAAQADRLVAGMAAEAEATRVAASAQLEMRANLNASTAAVVLYDDSLARTGGLSAAALQALGRGTLTVRDLGNQVTQTIGKFGGWTLAASSVYGVLGALNEVRHGVVDTSSILTGLQKFIPPQQYNPGSARQSIVTQAQDTATPIKDVGDAAQQFAKAFKNQTDVFTATHVALSASKLDNIDLADSYRYLTAIVQEAGVSVSQLPAIFDQVTAAQDKLGARVSVVLPALAASLGAVQTAGGNMSQLLGLEALTGVRSGLSGSSIGTAFARGATNFYPTPASRGTLSRYQLNPDQGFTQALVQALEKYGGGKLPGPQEQELAQAFFGPRFGSRLATLFNAGPAQTQHFLQETAPGQHSGLANKQLATTVGQTNNQLTLLKVNLQAIGAELGGTDLATPFGLALSAINGLLHASADLLKVWGELPGPMKEVASIGLVGGGAIGLARRFDLGGVLGNGGFAASVFTRNPAKAAASAAAENAANLRNDLSSQASRAAVDMRSGAREAIIAQQMGDEEAVAVAEAKQATAAARLAALDQMMVELKTGALTLQEDVNAGLVRQAAGAATAGGAGLGAVALGGGAAAGEAAAGGAITARLSASAASYEALAAQQGGMFATGMAGVTGAAAATAGGLSSLAKYAIPGAIAALVGFDMYKSTVKNAEQETSQGINKLNSAKTQADAAAAYNEVKFAGGLHIPLIGQTGIGEGVANQRNGTDAALDAAYAQKMAQLAAEGKAQTAAAQSLHGVNDILRAAQFASGKGQTKEYQQALEKLMTDKALEFIDPAMFHEAVANVQAKLAQAGGGPGGGNPILGQWVHEASVEKLSNYEQSMQATSDTAKVFGTSHGNIASLAAAYAEAVSHYSNANDPAAMQVLVQAQSDLLSAIDKQVQDLIGLAQASTTNKGQAGYYTQALGAVAQTEAKIREMYAGVEKIDAGNPQKLAQDHEAEQQILGQVAEKRQSAIQGLLSLLKSESDVTVSKIGGIGPEADLKRAEATLGGLHNQLSAAQSHGADAQTINQLLSQINSQAVTVLQDKVSYYQALSQAETAYAQSGTADPVQQQQIAVAQLQQLYAKLVAAGDKDKTQLLGILAQERSAALQKVSDQISLEQSQQQANLSQANIGQPQQVQLANAVSTAQKELAFLLALPKNKVNPSTLIQAYNNLYQAQGAVAQFEIQQGQSLISAEAALEAAKTFDPVQIAKIALAGAQKLLAYDTAHNAPAATLTQDAANVAADTKAVMEARWQKSESTIQFLAATYKITGATEIQRLQKLLQTMKAAHASYSDIQQVAQELWNLEYGNTGQLNLDTGSIHLPSTYEVKAAIRGAAAGARRKTNAGLLADVKTNVNMNVVIYKDADIKKFTKAIEDALGTSVNGLAQAAGMI